MNVQTLIDDLDAWPLFIAESQKGEVQAVGMLHMSEILSVLNIPRFHLGGTVERRSGEFYEFWDWAAWLKEISDNREEAFDIVYPRNVIFCDTWFKNILGLIPSLLNKGLANNILPNNLAKAIYLLDRERYETSQTTLDKYVVWSKGNGIDDPEEYAKRLSLESPLPPQMDLGILSSIDEAGIKLRIQLS